MSSTIIIENGVRMLINSVLVVVRESDREKLEQDISDGRPIVGGPLVWKDGKWMCIPIDTPEERGECS